MKTTAFAFTAAALTTSAAMLSGCTSAQTQVSWEADNTPQHTHQHQDWWNYQFVYYPQAQVYYEPHSKTYYWFADGIWNEGPVLPSRFVIRYDTPRVVKLESRYPYMHHHTVTKSFAMNMQPYEGSDFTTSPESFAAYMARYDDAVNSTSGQWAQHKTNAPFGSPFQPFRYPTSDSNTGPGHSATAEARSDAPNQ